MIGEDGRLVLGPEQVSGSWPRAWCSGEVAVCPFGGEHCCVGASEESFGVFGVGTEYSTTDARPDAELSEQQQRERLLYVLLDS
jgi:hypothetical protein